MTQILLLQHLQCGGVFMDLLARPFLYRLPMGQTPVYGGFGGGER